MFGLNEFIEQIKEYTDNYSVPGIIRLVVDAILVILILFGIYKFLKIKFHSKKGIWIILIVLLFWMIVNVFHLLITTRFLNVLLFWSIGVLVIVYNQEIKYAVSGLFQSAKNDNKFTSEEEKKEVIDLLVRTSDYLSKRKIGALMTIEREDNLNSFIEKAIYINGVISEELLTTIFTVGTACHDGAVIIRKNRIMCAGAYLPSTDRYDVPKSLGTRHRAAIGLSERFDAITIVVSEETGNISITADGAIEQALTQEKLREVLERYLIVK